MADTAVGLMATAYMDERWGVSVRMPRQINAKYKTPASSSPSFELYYATS